VRKKDALFIYKTVTQHLKKVILISFLFLTTFSNAQNSVHQTESNAEFNAIMNFVPKGLSTDLSLRPNNRFLHEQINTIGMLKVHYDLQEILKFNEPEIKWLEQRISELAVAFYLEQKPILIEHSGGYSGCLDEWLRTETINGIEVTILKFCYGCTDFSVNDENFIGIFNNRTEKLISIDRTTGK